MSADEVPAPDEYAVVKRTRELPRPSICTCGHLRVEHRGGQACGADRCGCTKFAKPNFWRDRL